MAAQPPSSSLKAPSLAAGLVAASCLVFWVFVIPYAAGHGDGRERIISWLTRHWSSETWLHGAFIPFAAIAMAWVSRDALRRAETKPSAAGFAVLALGFALLWAGYRTHVVYFGLGGVHLLVLGFILWFFGSAHTRILLYPIFFLLFTWPLPFLEASLSFHLRILMTECSGFLLNLFGADVTREGSALTWNGSEGPVFMEIEGACSGLRSLFSLCAGAALLGFFALRRFSDRVLLLLASVPIAIFGNIVRIVALYLGIGWWGWDTAVGSADAPSTFHMFAGILAIAAGLAGIVLLAALLGRRRKKRITITKSPPPFGSQSPRHAPGGAT